MKPFQLRITLFLLFLFIITAACKANTTSQPAPLPVTPVVTEGEKEEVEQDAADLPLLPSIQSDSGYGIGEPLPGGEEDPFAAATFILEAELPTGVETAVVQQHSFSPMDEALARIIANQLGFTGPLYIQQIAPEFAPPEGEEASIVYTALNGRQIVTISDTGVSYENRGVVMDYNQRPTFAEAAPALEAQLKAWGVLDFPYELQENPWGDVMVFRLVDGLTVEQNEFNFSINKEGEVAYFSYQPGRLVDNWGNYPLQTAEAAWQQLQSTTGRTDFRYMLQNLPDHDEAPFIDFVNPRSWVPLAETGQEIHLYITPAVYEATDGSGLRLVFGDYYLAGDENELAEIATHLSDVLHVWGTVEAVDGVKTLHIADWEKIDMVQYETIEGTLDHENGEAIIHSQNGETFILTAAPDLPDGVEVSVSVAARRDVGADYPVLDWNSITEKVEWPEFTPELEQELAVIQNVTIDTVELTYFVLHQPLPTQQIGETLLLIPTWRFAGITDQGQLATFWISAVAPEYVQAAPQPIPDSASIQGWVWHDMCATAMDGEPALTSAPEGCVEATSALGDYRANGHLDEMETLIGDVIVRLGAGTCPSTSLAETTTITTDLSYSFTGLPAGTYCVSINPSEEPNLSLLRPGIWTFPEVSEETIGTTVTLAEGENAFNVNFGWDHQFLP